jgi:hypothetical protein
MGFDSEDDDSPVMIQGYTLNVGKKRLQQVRPARPHLPFHPSRKKLPECISSTPPTTDKELAIDFQC